MIKQPITDEIKSEAMINAKILTERGKSMPNKFGINDTTETRYKGQIGELIFKDWLIEHHIKGNTWRIKEHDIIDDYDFMLEGSTNKIDVKTYHIRYNFNYMIENFKSLIAGQQIDKLMDYYVFVQLDENLTYAYIRGYIHRDTVINKYEIVSVEDSKFSIPIPCYQIPTHELGDIRELIYNETGKLIDGYIKPQKQMTMEDAMNIYLSPIAHKRKLQHSMEDY